MRIAATQDNVLRSNKPAQGREILIEGGCAARSSDSVSRGDETEP